MPDENIPAPPCAPPKIAGDSHRFWSALSFGLSGLATILSFVAPLAGPAGIVLHIAGLTVTMIAGTISTYYGMQGGGQVTLTSLADLVPTKLKTPPTIGPLAPGQ